MESIVDRWLTAMLWLLSAGAALTAGAGALGPSAQERAKKAWHWLALAAVVPGVAGVLPGMALWQVLALPYLCLTALTALRFALGLPLCCAAVGGALSGALWALQLLTAKALGSGPAVLLPVLAAVVPTVVLYIRRGCLFPKNYTQFLTFDSNGSLWRFPVYLWTVAGLLCLLTGWMAYLMLRTFPAKDQTVMALFSACALAALLGLSRGCALHFVDLAVGLLDRQYQAELTSFMQVIRAQRHDFNFHLQTLAGLIDRGEFEKCRSYVNTMVKEAGRTNDILLVRSPVLNAMLGTFQELAKRKEIELEILVQNDMENVPCTVYELNAIIGNLIQNAVDEVELHHMDNPRIQVMLLKRSGNNVARVTNPYSGSPEELHRALESGISGKKQRHPEIRTAPCKY